MLIVLMLVVIDMSRALNEIEVMAGLSRQGGNLASRGDTAAQTVAALMIGDAPLNLQLNGEVIVTAVTNNGSARRPQLVITDQANAGALTNPSNVGSGVGNTATLPASAAAIVQAGQTVYVTEVFYRYAPITPISKFVKLVLPATLYQAAYF